MTVSAERKRKIITRDGGVCAAPGCDHGDIQAKGLCRMHYFRLRRRGSLETPRPKRNRRGVCTVEGCEKTDNGQSHLCSMHETRVRRHGDVNAVHTPRVHVGADSTSWTGDDATYTAVHQRLRKKRGSASGQRCADCGRRARQWSYDRADENEKQSDEGPYSTDLSHYLPRCTPCHKRFDLAAIS